MKQILLIATSLFVLNLNSANALSSAKAKPQENFQHSSPAIASSVFVENPVAEELQRNKQLWAAQNLVNYRYTLRLGCFCLPEVTQPVVVEVSNGAVTSIVPANSGNPINPQYFEKYDSVTKLFDLVEDAIANNAHSIWVVYHPTLGYPTQISIDYSPLMADEEQYLTVENLEASK